MQTSRFQLGLIATLAMGLGFSLSASEASGYPVGSAVSLGSNPIFSAAGELTGSSTASIGTVPSDQTLIITDVILSSGNGDASCYANTAVSIQADGVDQGRFSVGVVHDTRSASSWNPQLVASLQSGIRLPPGSTIQIVTDQRYAFWCESGVFHVDYTVSGYYAQL